MSSSSDKVTVKWLEGWVDYEEEVSRSRIKTPNPLKIGMEVQVVCTLKQQYNIYSAKILKINRHGRDTDDSNTTTSNSTRPPSTTNKRNSHVNSSIKKSKRPSTSCDRNLPVHGALSKKAKRNSHDRGNALPDQDLDDDGVPPSSKSNHAHQSHNNSQTESGHSNKPLTVMTQITKILTELKQLTKQVTDLQAMVSEQSCTCMVQREVKTVRERIPKCVTMGDGQVQIGTEETSLLMLDENDYFAVWNHVDNAKDFIVKLLPKVFSNEQLKSSNFNGGQVFNGTDHVVKETLKDKEPFIAIMAQAGKEFPKSTASPDFERQLRYAVNNKCRKISSKSK